MHRLKWIVISLILTSFTILAPIQSYAEDEYLVVRIVDADYPPETYVHKDKDNTGFIINVHYQVENPTSSPIIIPYSCGPYPFPYIRINLRDKSLRVIRHYLIEWVAGETTLQPGYRNGSYMIYFVIENYVNESLPLGNYKFWFDYTNCSSSPVPVITEKLYLDVTENSVAYYFDYNNETRIVSSLQQTNYTIFFSSTSFLLLLVLCKGWNLRKEKYL